ncbi:MAG TPA: LysR family transcriptional regulator [Acetobacteraceae bacterium]|nr:LysR family transcriptional regulator [Acetobacteraceae bacterium]
MLDPVLLDSFLAVAQTRNFTEAGRRLGLRQSTVSQHVRKLEETAGRRLFVRDTHRVEPTADGEAMVGFARSILEANDRAERYFAGSQLRGRVRFGTSEDFVSSRLPEVLRDFVQRHPLVDVELTVDLSAKLNVMVDDGALDVALCKRRAGDDRGRLVWRDRLAWIGAEGTRIDPALPLPLIVYIPPSITRTAALETLERVGRPWRIVCSSGSLSGLRAAALAGLGVTVHARGLMPEGLSEVPAAYRLPELGEVEFVVQGGGRDPRGPAAALAETILANGDRLQRRE